MNKTVEIVIVGNGFGGTYTLKSLQKIFKGSKRVRLTLVGKKNYFLFTPLLHEVATGSINPENIIEPIRKVFRDCLDEFHLGVAKKVNLKEKTIEIKNKNETTTLKYDYLVLSGGAETNFYGTAGAEQYSMTLKDLEDAIKIKNKVIEQIEKAAHIKDEALRKQMLAFVVIGGGPTGVELAAELIELIKESFAVYYSRSIIRDATVTLIQKAPELLPQFKDKIRKKSLAVLQKKGVEVLLNASVVEVRKDAVILADQTIVRTENVIWVAGIKPATVAFDEKVEQLPDGKIVVGPTLTIENHSEVFVIGDMAAVKSKDAYLPALAQVAEKEAKNVAQNIKLSMKGKTLLPFTYKSSGMMISLGEWMAIGEICSFTIWGRLTWWLWRTVYLSKMISWQKKVKIAIDWTVDIFTPRDISEL